MKSLLAVSVAVVAIFAGSAGGADAHPSAVAARHCQNTHYGLQHLTITHIAAKRAGCTTARALSRAYESAVTLVTGPHPHNGHCYGAHSYGNCNVRTKGRTYACFHYNVVPKKTRGLVRCTAGRVLIKFNVGS